MLKTCESCRQKKKEAIMGVILKIKSNSFTNSGLDLSLILNKFVYNKSAFLDAF